MVLLLTEKISSEQLKNVSQDLDGYIKFVVDITREVMTAGGARHVEGEEMLLAEGSKQADLWGGGYDLETGDMDFDSMINIRPVQDNPSREVLDAKIRKSVEEVVKKLLIQ